MGSKHGGTGRAGVAAAELSAPVRLVAAPVRTPLGDLTLVTAEGRLCAAEFDDCHDRLTRWLTSRYRGRRYVLEAGAVPAAVTGAFAAYFRGDVEALGNLKVELTGTAFQRTVWTCLRTIPAGTTLSYTALAAAIERPSAVRAVGHANGANPISIIVPCHRVVGSSGSLTGYGGGLHRKRWLLAHEARHARRGPGHREAPGGG